MVNKKENEEVEVETEITHDDTDTIVEETEIDETEGNLQLKLKKLQTKLKDTETEARELRENLQRERAEFLNAKKRAEEARKGDSLRYTKAHVEDLLPLADSFTMAMGNKEVWEKADATWRQGIEGIYAQLKSLLNSHQVTEFNPTGEDFDPESHDAMGNIPVTDKNQHHKVQQVLQLGYEIKTPTGQTEIVRPARVLVGEFTENV